MAVETLFISYRRRDTPGWAGRLQADLRTRMPKGARIFMDVDGIPPGSDFASYIDQSIKHCDALIVVIGPDWVGAGSDGNRRIDDPHDWVRLEVESALRRSIRVIPLKVEGADLPDRDALPSGMRALANRQAVTVDNLSWDTEIGRLVTSFRDPPQLVVSPLRLDFGRLMVNTPMPPRRIQLSNAGDGDLAVTFTVSHRWMRVRDNGDSIDVWIDSTVAADLTGRIEILSAGGTATVAVTASVVDFPPPAAASPSPRPVRTIAAATPASAGPQQRRQPLASVQQRSQPSQPLSQPLSQPFSQQVGPASSHLLLSLVAVVIGLGVGAIPLVYSLNVRDLNRRGAYADAHRASGKALVWGLVITVLAVMMWLIYLGSAPV